MGIKTKSLVVDTSGFLRNLPLWEYGEVLVTVDEVFAEIKNRKLQEYVAAFPIAVDYRQPRPESIKFINEFSKKTGDYHCMSLTDIKVLALTYELEVEERGSSEHLRTQPLKKVVNTQQSIPVAQLAAQDDANRLESLPEEEEDEEKEEECTTDDVSPATETSGDSTEDDDWCFVRKKRRTAPPQTVPDDGVSVTSSVARKRLDVMPRDMQPGFYLAPDEDDQQEGLESDDEEGDDEEDEGEGGWITPDNISQLMAGEETDWGLGEDRSTVACMTGDFAMQNVMRHIGLEVLGVDGKLIRDARVYMLRCFACYNVTSDMNKLFCQKCGNRTLKRVSVTTNTDGTQNIWISRRPLSARGTKYNLPKPRGGQHAVMPLLTADQRFPQQWAKRTKTVNALNPDYIAGPSPFTARDLSSRAAQHGNLFGQERGIKGHFKHAKIWKPKKHKGVKK